MNNIAVVYKSKYGNSKTYAEWIANGLEADIYNRDDIKSKDLEKYETIIYGAGLYGGKIAGMDFINKGEKVFKDKNLIVFACGLSEVNEEGSCRDIEVIKDKIFMGELTGKVFYFRGGIDYSSLNFVDSKMLKVFVKFLMNKSEEELTPGVRNIIETYGKTVDYKEKDSIKPMVEYVKSL